MSTPVQKVRPKYLNLFKIKLPLPGIVSIGHRISGVLLVLSIPLWLYTLELSLNGPNGFAEAKAWLHGFFISLFSIVVLWSLVHHFFAGIRFLLLDLDIGVEKTQAIKYSKLVFVVEGISMLFVIGWIL